MAGGSALDLYTDFTLDTPSTVVTGVNDLCIEFSKHTYVLKRMARGDVKRMIAGGKTIKDQLIANDPQTSDFYEGEESITWQNKQVQDEWEMRWRRQYGHYIIEAAEVELQDGKYPDFKKIRHAKEAASVMSKINKMEDQLWRVPVAANMEASGGKQPFSILAWVNEMTNGQFFSAAAGNHDSTGGTAWTTKGSINPSTETFWRPKQRDYTSSAINNAANITSIFDRMFKDVRFQAPGIREEYLKNDMMYKQVIYSSNAGVSIYQQQLREQQDTLVMVGRQDPAFITPQYAGIDVEYIDALDTVAAYADEAQTGLTTEMSGAGTAEDNGPRYYWLNLAYLYPVFHSRRYFLQLKPKQDSSQVDTRIMVNDTWWNLICASLRHQGIVSPLGDIYTA